MTTMLELAKWLNSGNNDTQLTNVSYTASDSSASIRIGSVVGVGEDGYIQVSLDPTDVVVDVYVGNVPYNVGDVVSIIKNGNTWVIYDIETFVEDAEIANKNLSTQIREQGEELSRDLLESLAEFERTHGLEDMDVTKTIEDLDSSFKRCFQGVIKTGKVDYSTITQFIQSVYDTQITADKVYSVDGQGKVSLNSNVTVSPSAIVSQVKSEIVNTILKGTYATSNEVKAESDKLTVRITAATNKANEVERKIETYFKFDNDGLTVSADENGVKTFKTRMAPGSFDLLWPNGNKVFTIVPIEDEEAVRLAFGHDTIDEGSLYLSSGWNGGSALFGNRSTALQTSRGQWEVGDLGDLDTYTPLADKGDDLLKLLGLITLYSGSTTGNVALSDSAANYQLLLIMFTNTDGHQSSVVAKPSGTISLTLTFANNVGFYMQTKQLTVSGKNLNVSSFGNSYIKYGASDINAAKDTNYIKVTRVYGLR